MSPTPQKLVYIKTFGCQMNEHDSDRIRALLAQEGYASTDTTDNADLILFNTCTIREKAHHKAVSQLGRIPDFKAARPGALVGICGCVAQEEGAKLLERFDGLDFAFGPDQIHELPRLIGEAQQGKRPAALDLINDSEQYRFLDLDTGVTSHELRVTNFVSIMKGCNCFCTYCIVPYVRGREVCRDPDAIVAEVGRLADAGTKEVTLLGQNVNAYAFPGHGSRLPAEALVAGVTGHEKFNGLSFPDLLRRIAHETPITRIRFMSPHPKDVGDDLIREYAENEKLMPHIHLPVQAGANAVLKRMNRGYTREDYLNIIERLRAARPDMSITTDIIVGFCGESDADFRQTLDLIEQVGFDSAFAFKYSPRAGTRAAEQFADDIPTVDKERRLDDLLTRVRTLSRAANETRIGTVSDALVTGTDRMGRGMMTGRLPDNRIIHFAGKADDLGAIVRLRITAAYDNSLAGERAS